MKCSPAIVVLAGWLVVPTLAAQQAADGGAKVPRPAQDGPVIKSAAVRGPMELYREQGPAPVAVREGAAYAAASRGADRAGLGTEVIAAPEFAGVLIDDGNTGAVWAAGPTWKAGFDADGVTFVPFFGSDAPSNRPLRLATAAARVGEVAIECADLGVRRVGEVVELSRGGMMELYLTSAAGIEQRFVFEQLPARGELCVEIGTVGEYAVRRDGDEHVLECDLGSFRYGAPVAFDAAGRRVAMQASWSEGVLRLTVPESFVRQAQLPLVIDPLLGNVVSLAGSPYRHVATDVMFDASLATHLACYERVFSQTDSDVIAVRLTDQLQPIGVPFGIDLTTAAWRACRTAGLDVFDKALVVAEGETTPGAIVAIVGRTVHLGTGATSAQFDIERGVRSCRKPDVGGDPSPMAPTYWTVAFERHWSTTDRDIMLRQVTESATLRGNGMTTVDAAVTDHTSPVISRSNGDGVFTQQSWLLAYREHSGGGQVRTVGRFVSWDGQLQGSLSPGAWWNETARMALAVSSPTSTSLGQRYVVVDGVLDPITQFMVLYGTAYDAQGSFVALRQRLTETIDDRSEPAVETDGSRFALAYSFTDYPGAPQSWANVRTYDLVGNALRQCDIDQPAPTDSTNARPALCSRYSGGMATPHLRDRQYAMVWQQYGVSGDTMVGMRYLGHATLGGVTFRQTGCGMGGGMVASTGLSGAIGSTSVATISYSSGLVGWVLGLPMSAPIAGCGGCTQGSTAMVTTIGPATTVQIPYDGAFVGLTLALQPFAFGPGTCLGSLAFGDTVDLTIR